jgi:hypothetical protein
VFLADHPDINEDDLITIGEDGTRKYHPEYEKAIHLRIDALESRYLSECADVARQTEALIASEQGYIDQMATKVAGLEQILKSLGPDGLGAEQGAEYQRLKKQLPLEPLTTKGIIGMWGDRSDLATKYYLLVDGLSDELREGSFRSMWEDATEEQGLIRLRSELMVTRLRELDPNDKLALPDLGSALAAMRPGDRKIFDHLRQELEGDSLLYQKLNDRMIWSRLSYTDGKLRSEQAREFIELQRQQTETYFKFLSAIALIHLLVKSQAGEQTIEPPITA